MYFPPDYPIANRYEGRAAMNFKRGVLAVSAALAAILAGSTARAEVTAQDILNDQKTVEDVVTHGSGPRGQRYSPLANIDTGNVAHLVPAWSFSFGGGKLRGEQSQAVMSDGIVYVTGSYSRIWAIDSQTGEEIWQYDAPLPEDIKPCCGVANRGAVLFKDKVYFGTLDAYLVALDAKNGKLAWRKKIGDYKEGYSYTAAPLIVNGMVVTGVSGGDYGIVGRVEARNADTGDLVWSRPIIEGHVGTLNGKPSTMTGMAGESWPGDTWKRGGGAPSLGGTYDPDTNLLYFGTGHPMPWNSHQRPGDNKWTSSRLAINPQNGEIVWGFQTTPNDSWGYGGTNEFIPFDYRLDGKTVKAGATADANGFFFVLDRTDGAFIRASQYARDVTWARGIDRSGRPVVTKGGRPGNPVDSASGQIGSSVFAAPSFLGGKNRNPMAYSPQTGFFYIPSNEWGMDLWNTPATYVKGMPYKGAGHTVKPLYEYIGSLKAMDPTTGKIVWEVRNKAPFWGGVLATAGGLVFTGTPEGYLKAFDAKNGKELWKFNTGSGIVAPPISWEEDGEQYIGVASGWGGAQQLWGKGVAKVLKHVNQGGSYWVFKLQRHKAREPL